MGEWFRAGPHPSGWDFEHYHRGGDDWHLMGHGPGDAQMGLDYTKHPGDKVEFNRSDDEHNRQQNPEHAALLRQHALEFHHSTEHTPAPPPAPRKNRPLYHGTAVAGVTHILPARQHGKGVNYDSVTDPSYAYATHSKEDAWEYAMEAAGDEKRPRVYQVHPIGGYKHVEDDPDWDPVHRMSRGVREEDKRSLKGFRVVKEMPAPQEVRNWYDDKTWGKD